MRLWRSTIDRANYPPPLNQPPMVLPKINTIVGGHIEEFPSIHDQLIASYAKYSANYWLSLRSRQKLEGQAQKSKSTKNELNEQEEL